MKSIIFKIFVVIALSSVISQPAFGSCFGSDACQFSECKTAEIVNCPGSGFFCQPCFSPAEPCARITTAIPIFGGCTVCGGICSIAPASVPDDDLLNKLFVDEAVSPNASNPDGIEFNLIFSRDLKEFEAIWDQPHKLLPLLLLERTPGALAVDHNSIYQLGVSTAESRNSLMQRIETGLPLAEVDSSNQLSPDLPIAIDYMVDLAAYKVDSTSLELIVEAWPAAKFGITGPETRLTVHVNNRESQAPHEYSIEGVEFERLQLDDRNGKRQ